jgi:hypothetical protein
MNGQLYRTDSSLGTVLIRISLLRKSSLLNGHSVERTRTAIFFFCLSPNRPIRYLLRSAWFLFPLWCGGAPGYFPRLPTPTLSPLLFLDDTTRISQHTTSIGGHPAWDLNPADLAVVSGECRSSFHHPTVSLY